MFNAYLPRRYYLHRDLFRDALAGMLERFGARLDEGLHVRHEASLRERQQRDFTLREGVRETLDALRARGLGLGIVSNIDEDQLEHLVRAGELAARFDWMLSSEAARSCKPDPAIFRMALERAGCAPHEALFVGDTLRQDIAGARRAGLHSVLLWHRDDRAPDLDSEPVGSVIRAIPDLLALIDGTPW